MITASGKLVAPAAATIACGGKVQVVVKAGKKTVLSRKVALKKKGASCTYKTVLTFKKLPKSLPASGKVSVSARFLGNKGLVARAAKAGTVRLG